MCVFTCVCVCACVCELTMSWWVILGSKRALSTHHCNLDTKEFAVLRNPCFFFTLQQSPEGPRWTQAQSFELTVTEPTKKSKLKGMKSFIAYTISMSVSYVAVWEYHCCSFMLLHKTVPYAFIHTYSQLLASSHNTIGYVGSALGAASAPGNFAGW